MDLPKETGLISIIIPVYNTIDYLERCLDSVCNQTYKNLEIICVDDGSTDGCDEIVDAYAKRDNRIIAIHQINGGESAARNTGLKNVSGQYIGFVDCDDWIEPEMYQNLMILMEEKDVDIVASGYYSDWIDRSEKAVNKCIVSKNIIDRKELLNYVYQRDNYRGVSAFIWNKLYKREILYKDGQLCLFDTSLKLGGDVYYFAQLACRVNRVTYSSEAYYHYFQRPSSTWHTTNIDIRKDMLLAYQKVLLTFEKENMEKDILVWVKRFLAFHASMVAQIAVQQENRSELTYCQNIMKTYQTEYESKNYQYPERIDEFRKILDK